jgi:hypothetical protein
LTGQEIALTSQINPNNGGRLGWANGISVDQAIAAHIGGATPFRSLELGVQVSGGYYGRISFSGPNKPVAPENDPAAAFRRLFSDAGLTAPEADAARGRRKKILDAVAEQFRNVRGKVGAEDQRRLDAHAAFLDELERRVTMAPPATSGSCMKPTLATPPALRENDNYPAIGKLQMDLLVMALQCDLVRVVTLTWGGAAGGPPRFTWEGITRECHSISHFGDDGNGIIWKTAIQRWYAEQFSYLVGRMKATSEAGGSLLDSSLVFWCNELGMGNNHSLLNVPFVLAGRAGGALRTGRYLKYEGPSPSRANVRHNDLLVSLHNAMGMPVTTFGKSDWCTGPLPGLL